MGARNLSHPLRRVAREAGITLQAIGAELGVSKSAVSQWMMPNREVPIKHCASLEALSRGKVSRQQLRPNDWAQIWPELTQKNVTNGDFLVTGDMSNDLASANEVPN